MKLCLVLKPRKATSPLHFLLGAFCAVLWPYFAGLSLLIWLTFVAYELWSDLCGHKEGYKDVWEGLLGLVFGALLVFAWRVLWTLLAIPGQVLVVV